MSKLSRTAGVALAAVAAAGVVLATPAGAAAPTPTPANVVAIPQVRVVDVPGVDIGNGGVATIPTAGKVGVPTNATGVEGILSVYLDTGVSRLVAWDGASGAPGVPTVIGTRTTVAQPSGESSPFHVALVNGAFKVHNTGAETHFLVTLTGYDVPAAAGPTGPAGPPGRDAPGPTTSTANTVLSDWPESSDWANDTFGRVATVTLEDEVDANRCGAGAQRCFFYVGTLNDTGSFVTVDGAATPNGTGGTVHGANNGSLVGTTRVEFYATSDQPDGSLVKTAVTGADKGGRVTTSAWVEQFFPDAVTFGPVTLVTYDFEYTAPGSCEHWTDTINPGDDGQSAADGNITGVSAC